MHCYEAPIAHAEQLRTAGFRGVIVHALDDTSWGPAVHYPASSWLRYVPRR